MPLWACIPSPNVPKEDDIDVFGSNHYTHALYIKVI